MSSLSQEKSSFLDLFKQSKLYWICTSITAALCYGFTITNATLLTDDLVWESHFNEHVVLAAHRWGYLILRDVFDTLIYLSYWRAFLGLLLLIAGMTIFCGLYKRYSGGRFDDKAAVILTCVGISFPWIADIFVLTTATVAVGWMVVLTAISLFFACRWIIEKKHFLNLVPGTLLLSYSIAFYEPSVVLFLVGGFSLLLIKSIFDEEAKGFLKTLLMSIKIIAIVIAGVIVWRLIAVFFQYLLSVSTIYYTEKLVFYDTSNAWILIKSFLWFSLGFIRLVILMPFSEGVSAVSIIVWLAAALLILTGLFLSVKHKKPAICFLGIATAVSAYGMYFALGNASLLNRYVFTFFLLVAFTLALFYVITRDIAYKKFKVRYLVLFIAFWLVFVQSREMNQVYHLDYERHERDVMILNTIVHDLGELQEKPVVFVGFLPDVMPTRDRFVGVSLFTINRDAPSVELDSFWIEAFFRTQKFPLPARTISVDENEVRNQIIGMPNWPQYGYIKELDDYFIVKLGPSFFD